MGISNKNLHPEHETRILRYNTTLTAWKVFPYARPTVSALPPEAFNPHVLQLDTYLGESQVIYF